jgi:hypothetical protein
MTAHIEMFNHDDEKLWCRIGKFFADKKIRQELGGPMSSDTNHKWWVAEVKGRVSGFACVEMMKKTIFFRHAYVLEAYRSNGVYASLLTARIRFAKAGQWGHITAYCTAGSKPSLEKAGFKLIGERGKYFTMRFPLS